MKNEGIDVSTWQGNIDWSTVAKSKVTFAMIRSSFGSTGVDNKFALNMKNIAKTQLDRGAYHYCYAKNTDEAIIEARHFINTISPYQFNYPIALDLEDPSLTGLGKTLLTDIAFSFCNTLENAGFYTIIYANLNWLVNYLDMERLKMFDVWLAQWGPSPKYSGNFGLWQYSATGSVPGIDGDVDLNISYWDYPAIIAQNGLNKLKKPADTPSTPQPTPQTTSYTVVSGDTLSSISQRFLGAGSRYNEIMSLNGLSSDLIHPGEILKLPLDKEFTEGVTTYVVTSGDTLWSIAKQMLGSGNRYNEIISLNKLENDVIYVGQVLRLP